MEPASRRSQKVNPPLLPFTFPLFDIFTVDPGNVTLKLEMPTLRTGESFDSLHCYASLADSLPQWYPDRDNDQATDESFPSGDDGLWITDGFLAGDSAPLISWPTDLPLPLTMNCVGILGGTEALDLGQINLEIPPEDWDGIQKSHESDGDGGHLLAEIRISQLSGNPRNTPKYPLDQTCPNLIMSA